MRVLAFSDLHHSRARAEALVAASQEADLVIGAGDFCNHRTNLAEAMNLLFGIVAPFVVVPGNAESAEELREAAHVDTVVLHGERAKVAGLEVFGLGYAVPETPFGDWSCDLSEKQAEQMLARCTHADVMIVHSPPKGIADMTSQGNHMGSSAIHAAITRVQPDLALCGHIHESWGREGQIGRTRVCNLGPNGLWFDL